MAVTFPYDLLAGFPGWQEGPMKIMRRQERSRSASGKTYVKDVGDPLWTITYMTKPLKPNALDKWRARLDILDEGLNTFKAYNLSRCYPIAHPKGSWPGGVVGGVSRSGSFITGAYRANGLVITAAQAFSVARSTVKNILNPSGVWTQYAPGTPAFTGAGGLSVEDARTNLLTQSGDVANAVWSKTRVTASGNSAVAPDGTTTAAKIVEDTTATSTHVASRSITPLGNTTYTWSVFLKAAERTFAQVSISVSSSQVALNVVDINLTNGSFTATDNSRTKVESYPNGWWRVSSTITTVASPANIGPSVSLATSSGVISYTGDGSSGIYMWGGQFEVGDSSSSYIITTGSSATRDADSVTVFGGTSISDWTISSTGSPNTIVPGVNGNIVVTRATLPKDYFSSYSAVRVGGNDFDGSGLVSVIAANRKEIRVSGYPVGFTFSEGDMIMIGEGRSYRVVNDVVISSTTTSPYIEVRPSLRIDVAVGNAVSASHPWVLMSIDPDSSGSAAALDGRGVVSFSATEVV